MNHPTPSRGVVLATTLSLAACAGPTWTAREQRDLAELQAAVQRALLVNDASLQFPTSTKMTPDHQVDDLLLPVPELEALRPEGIDEGWRVGDHRHLTAMWWLGTGPKLLTVAGHQVRNLDAMHDLVLSPNRGAVLLATRRGRQTVATNRSLWSGQLWHPDFRPSLSGDGSHFVYVQDGWFGDTVMLARTDEPTAGIAVHFPGQVQWPVWPGRDGRELCAIVTVGDRQRVLRGDRVIAEARSIRRAWFDQRHDRLDAVLVDDDGERLLRGERISPPQPEYRWWQDSPDGAHYGAVARDGEVERLIVDDRTVLQHPHIEMFWIATSSGTWVATFRQNGQHFVVHEGGRIGPLPEIADVALAPDGSKFAIRSRVDRIHTWTIDGQPLGTDYEHVSQVQLLARGAGAVFVGHRGAQCWLVTPHGADGPWHRIDRHVPTTDGSGTVMIAERDGIVHRRCVPTTPAH